MKRKEFIFSVIVLVIAFIGITIFKHWKHPEQNNSSISIAKSDSMQKFWVYYNRATQQRMDEESDSSIIAYQEALKFNPGHKDALYYIGNMYMNVGQFDKAQDSWGKLTELNPQSERAFNQLGNLFFCMSHPNYFHPEKSKLYFEKAFAINKEALNPNLHLGEIALFQNRIDNALVIFHKLLMMDQKNMEINFIMGYLNWKSGKSQEATKDFEHASELLKTTNPVQKKSNVENPECNLFMYWLTNNLMSAKEYDIRIAMPTLYKKFDQYLIMMRGKLNHD